MKKLKYTVAGWIKQEPHAWALVWNLMPRLTFLLPHDKSYYGFRHLANKERGLFLDVGANNGISAAGFRRINDTYDILSIEANRHHEKALKRLQRSISGFDYRRLGAGCEKGSFVLFTPMYNGIPIHTHSSTSKKYMNVSLSRDFSSRVVKKITYDEQEIPVLPLDELKLEPDIVKVDVEGFDLQVLLGMRRTIEKHRPYIMIEYTPEEMGDFESLFEELGYGMFVYDEQKDRFSEFQEDRETDTWHTTAVQVNLFCVPDENISVLPLNGA